MEKATSVAADPAAACCGVGGRLSESGFEVFTEFLRFYAIDLYVKNLLNSVLYM